MFDHFKTCWGTFSTGAWLGRKFGTRKINHKVMTWIFIRYYFVFLLLFTKLCCRLIWTAVLCHFNWHCLTSDLLSPQGSLHYSTTTDRKLDQKRWDRPRRHIDPQGHQLSVRCRLAIEIPQPILTFNTQYSQSHPVHSLKRSLYVAHAIANLISCKGGATLPPKKHSHSRPRTERQ